MMIRLTDNRWLETDLIETVMVDNDLTVFVTLGMSSGHDVILTRGEFNLYEGIILKSSKMGQEAFAG